MTVLDMDERAALADAVGAACRRLASEDRVRAVALDREGPDRGFDRELWRTLSGQIGIGAIAVPEHLGGAGLGASAQAVVAHELGRVLAPVPFLASSVLSTGLLVGGRADEDVLQPLVEGTKTAATAIVTRAGSWDSEATTVTARDDGGSWALSGTVRHVLNGATAETIVVVARIDSEAAVFVVESSGPGVTAAPERVLDPTRPMATVTLADCPAQRLSPTQPVRTLVDRCLDRAIAILSAEQTGACERVLEMATDYARTREQFGRPIGSFQAVKHLCSDMLVGYEMSRSASMAAAECVDDSEDAVRWRISMAKAMCSEVFRSAANSNLQVHGGVGFTWEHAVGMYLKRACTDEVLLGRPGEHWTKMADLLALFEPK